MDLRRERYLRDVALSIDNIHMLIGTLIGREVWLAQFFPAVLPNFPRMILILINRLRKEEVRHS